MMVSSYILYKPSYTLVNLRLVNYKVNRDGSIRAEIEATQDTHARKLKSDFMPASQFPVQQVKLEQC